MEKLPQLTVQVTVNISIEKAWRLWTAPEHIMKWNIIGDDWVTPKVENDAKQGGAFFYRMEKKDGSFSFDFTGNYDEAVKPALLRYTLTDGRTVANTFTANGNETTVTETFDPETETPIDVQRDFCLQVLNSFKKYAEHTMD